MPKILVVIPAYNEQECIVDVVNHLTKVCPIVDYVVINDCSTDSTKRILHDNQLNFIDLPVNLGIGGGVQTGYKYAVEHGYDIVVQFDGDGQHRAEYINDILQPILCGNADMVIGSRFLEKKGFQTSFFRRWGINIIKGLIWICCGKKIRDTTSGFRATSKELTHYFSVNYAQDYPEPEAIVTALSLGYKVVEIPVQMNERQGGVSSIRAFKSIYYMIKVSLAVLIARMVRKKQKGDQK